MGTTAQSVSGDPRLSSLPSREHSALRILWKRILNYSFDSLNFTPLKIFQDVYAMPDYTFVGPEYLAAVLLQLKRFLFLAGVCILVPKAKLFPWQLAPPPAVDRLWQILIQNQKLYSLFCRRVFKGHFLHRDSNQVVRVCNYQATCKLYRQVFGKAPSHRIWRQLSHTSIEQAHRYIAISRTTFDRITIDIPHPRSDTQNDILFRKWMATLRENEKAISNSSIIGSSIEEDSFDSREELKGQENQVVEQNARLLAKIQSVNQARMTILDEIQQQESTLELSQRLNSSLLANKPKIQLLRPAGDQQISIGSDDEEEEQDKTQESKGVSSSSTHISFLSARKDDIEDRATVHSTAPTSESRLLAETIEVVLIERGVAEYMRKDWKERLPRVKGRLDTQELPKVVIRKARYEHCMSHSAVRQSFSELKKYILLTQLVRRSARLVPSANLMRLWNLFIQQTEAYDSFCEYISGKKIKAPVIAREVQDNQITQYTLTLDIYEAFFREAPTSLFWEPTEARFSLGMGPRAISLWAHLEMSGMAWLPKGGSAMMLETMEFKKKGGEGSGKTAKEVVRKEELRLREQAMERMEVGWEETRTRSRVV